ncbi:hypothetical protein BT69DRAFT_1292711 [Atractiella rhizophila]|nr:hypothetical protein BT69DRAFT_1339589 [Atractiella rhizophila]KAH8929180.1 hypothetical protein BT69DRAFT_281243 [Atractiella rhizophila]KAH8929182.1 hypothetical protein BT69DRAFT_1292711 [Atractiella rhizophila]
MSLQFPTMQMPTLPNPLNLLPFSRPPSPTAPNPDIPTPKRNKRFSSEPWRTHARGTKSLALPSPTASTFAEASTVMSVAANKHQRGLSVNRVNQAVYMAQEAVASQEEDLEYSLDCYLTSLDYLISAFPNVQEGNMSNRRKHAFQSKLFLLLAKLNNDPPNQAQARPKALKAAREASSSSVDPDDSYTDTSQTWQESIEGFLITLAIHLRRSPLPTILALLISYAVHLEKTFQLRRRFFALAILGIQLMCVLWEGGRKAVAAYGQEGKRRQFERTWTIGGNQVVLTSEQREVAEESWGF